MGVILIAATYGTVLFLFNVRRDATAAYKWYKSHLAKAMLLGLELLVAADIVRTIGVGASLEDVAVLGLLIVVRPFLSWSLEVEIDGRWPWEAGGPARQPDTLKPTRWTRPSIGSVPT